MKSTTLAIMALAVLLVIQPALAQGAKPPAPSKDMAQLSFFRGSWTCTGEVPASAMGPAHKSKSGVVTRDELDGAWLTVHVNEAGGPDNPHPFKGMAQMGFDAVAKNYLMLWVDNSSGWAAQTSTGWEGDRMVFTGDGSMGGKKLTARDTFTKKGAAFHHLGELQIDGKWVVVQDENCQRPAVAKN
jgi:hypothetical protein